jgi:hypothetical protein
MAVMQVKKPKIEFFFLEFSGQKVLKILGEKLLYYLKKLDSSKPGIVPPGVI